MRSEFMLASQFARLCRVTRQTLIYYDRIGLFHPVYTDTNGYRHYSIRQHEQFLIISMLRELDTPLSEIREYMDKRSPEEMLELLEKKEQEVRERMNRLRMISYLINERKQMTYDAKAYSRLTRTDSIIEESCSESWILKSPDIEGHEDMDYIKSIRKLEGDLEKIHIRSFNINGMIAMDRIEPDSPYHISCFYVEVPKRRKGAERKPGGTYLSTFHRGSFETIAQTYERLISHIRDHGYEIIGGIYEYMMYDSFTHMDPDDYLIKLSIPIQK